MGVIIGLIGVTVSVLGGFVMAGGPLPVLIQPNEFVVIGGAAIFSLVTANPGAVIHSLFPALKSAIAGSGVDGGTYRDLLGLMASVFDTMRKEGVLGIEGDLADPEKSPRFN